VADLTSRMVTVKYSVSMRILIRMSNSRNWSDADAELQMVFSVPLKPTNPQDIITQKTNVDSAVTIQI
jgi:hypothetical protein